MNYKGLLFDADGTLLDFKKSEQVGLQNVFDKHNVELTDDILNAYLAINEVLWSGFEQGSFTKQHIFDVRYQMVLDKFHIEGDGQEWEACYREELNKGSHLIENALSMCEQLKTSYALYIVTNGLSKTQYQRLQDSGLDKYFLNIFVSEDIGYQKPQKEYFDYVLENVPYKKDELLLIGDSLSSDIKGSNMAGIKSCWFNPEHLKNHSDAIPDYEIAHLEELWKIV